MPPTTSLAKRKAQFDELLATSAPTSFFSQVCLLYMTPIEYAEWEFSLEWAPGEDNAFHIAAEGLIFHRKV